MLSRLYSICGLLAWESRLRALSPARSPLKSKIECKAHLIYRFLMIMRDIPVISYTLAQCERNNEKESVLPTKFLSGSDKWQRTYLKQKSHLVLLETSKKSKRGFFFFFLDGFSSLSCLFSSFFSRRIWSCSSKEEEGSLVNSSSRLYRDLLWQGKFPWIDKVWLAGSFTVRKLARETKKCLILCPLLRSISQPFSPYSCRNFVTTKADYRCDFRKQYLEGVCIHAGISFFLFSLMQTRQSLIPNSLPSAPANKNRYNFRYSSHQHSKQFKARFHEEFGRLSVKVAGFENFSQIILGD